jgi:hypothetical protein
MNLVKQQTSSDTVLIASSSFRIVKCEREVNAKSTGVVSVISKAIMVVFVFLSGKLCNWGAE